MMYLLGSFFLSCLLSGCIGPKHVVPQHMFPETFEHQNGAHTTDDDHTQWWHTYCDEQLNDLVARALECNYTLAIAAERIEAFRALYRLKRADLFPQINGVAEINRRQVSSVLAQTAFIPTQRVSFFDFGFDGSWELDFWGRTFREKRARLYDMQAQIEAFDDIRLVLIADVIRAYSDICALNVVLSLVAHQIEIRTRLFYLEDALCNAGLASDITVQQRAQLLATAQDTYEGLITERAKIKHALAVLCGSNPEDVAMPTRDTVPLVQELFTTGLPSELLRRRPDIRQKERELAASNQRVGQAIAEWFPRFTLLGGLGSASSTGSQWFSSGSLAWDIGPSVSWPILNFGRVKANIQVRDSEKRQAALAYSQTIIAALQDVEDFLVAYFQAEQQRCIQQHKKEAAHVEALLQEYKFASGLENERTYLNALDNELAVSIAYTRIEQQLSSTTIAVYKALGGAW